MTLRTPRETIAGTVNDSRHVNPEEFLTCAVARTRWERTTLVEGGLAGLVDPDSGEFIVVDAVALERFRLLPR